MKILLLYVQVEPDMLSTLSDRMKSISALLTQWDD